MQKIGIYGGTFNPIHNGHIHLIAEFYKRLNLDKIIVIPTNVPPHKISNDLADGSVRMEMCKIALSELNINWQVSDIEMHRNKKSYTADTLTELKIQYPEDSLYFIMGEDMFLSLDKWYKPQVIFSKAVMCASPRSENGYNSMVEYGKSMSNKFKDFKCIIEDIEYIPVSSTEIRGSTAELKKSVPQGVAEYIINNNIYSLIAAE